MEYASSPTWSLAVIFSLNLEQAPPYLEYLFNQTSTVSLVSMTRCFLTTVPVGPSLNYLHLIAISATLNISNMRNNITSFDVCHVSSCSQGSSLASLRAVVIFLSVCLGSSFFLQNLCLPVCLSLEYNHSHYRTLASSYQSLSETYYNDGSC